MSTLITLLHVAESEHTDTFQSDLRVQPGASYLVALSSSVVVLVGAVGTCPIVDGTRFDTATSLMARTAMKCID